jgi:hypothetical protein
MIEKRAMLTLTWAIAQKSTPDGTPASPLALYQRPILAVCSSRFHHDEEMRTKPGFRHDSNTPKKNRAAAKVENFVALPVAANTAPARASSLEMKLKISLQRAYPKG